MGVELFSDDYLKKADRIFLTPSPTYCWNSIIKGVGVNSESGVHRTLLAVAQNTFRGFHRIDKNCPGAKDVFVKYFVSNGDNLIQQLKEVKTRQGLNDFSNEVCQEIKTLLSNCKQEQLISYNKLRKPIDLYIEHLVSMATELNEHRQRLIPLLFLPLDSQIFAHEGLFSAHELGQVRLNRNSTYQDVMSESVYCDLQKKLSEKASFVAEQRKKDFFVIYFDLIWNERYNNWGGNLFETNPL